MRLKGISVVIPNYNGRQLLPQILPCLFIALNKAGQPYEVIISDDCSKDDSILYLEQHFPEIQVLKSEDNRGFSPTINKGIFAAKFDLVLLLNSDVKLEPDYFKTLLRYFEKEDTFGVMGRIVGWEDENIQDAAKYPSFHGVKIKTSGNYYAVNPTENDWLFSMYLSGANALIDRQKLITLSGFNELFAPFYVEDFELSLRAWRLGWKSYYDHFAICRHQTSVSIKTKNSKAAINTIYYRNKMFLHAIHLSKERLALWYLQMIPETLIRIFTLRFYYLKSLKMFFASSDKIKLAKKNLELLASRENKLLSSEEVVAVILDSIKGRPIEQF